MEISRLKFFANIRKRLVNVVKNDLDINKNGEVHIGRLKVVKRIGNKSKNGLIFLGELGNYQLSLKITSFNKKKATELKNLEETTNAVLDGKTHRFPMLFGYKIFEGGLDDYQRFPKEYHKFLKKTFIIYFNELADGDLRDFLNKNYGNDKLVLNALSQVLMSLIDFYKITGKLHKDSHSGNFLYHDIKPGGYFHYNIQGIDCYIKNLGYLWIIWDYEQSVSLKAPLSNHKVKLTIGYDFKTIFYNFYNLNNFLNIKNKLFGLPSKLYNYEYTNNNMNNYIKEIIECLFDNNYLLKNIPLGEKIINPKPYKLNKIEV